MYARRRDIPEILEFPALKAGGEFNTEMEQLRSHTSSNAVVEFNGCYMFNGEAGKAFAIAARDFFTENGKFPGRKVVGCLGYTPFGNSVELPSEKDPDW